MPSLRRIWNLFALSLLALAALPSAAQTQVVEEIVGRINETIVTRSEFERSKTQLKQELTQQFGADAQAKYAEREKDILRDLIDQRLLVQRAKDNGIAVENDLIKRLDEMRKSMNLQSMEDASTRQKPKPKNCWRRSAGAQNSKMWPRETRTAPRHPTAGC
ncbi:MAG: SurA N-terminal domain-containing protein [Acidobacteriales bacterium]|nr:SurA N-terminal domain-containing protein [Terriglobales bacterium]